MHDKSQPNIPMHSGMFWSKKGHFWGFGKVENVDFFGNFWIALIFGLLYTANLNGKNLATNSSWDFDANFETSAPS